MQGLPTSSLSTTLAQGTESMGWGYDFLCRSLVLMDGIRQGGKYGMTGTNLHVCLIGPIERRCRRGDGRGTVLDLVNMCSPNRSAARTQIPELVHVDTQRRRCSGTWLCHKW